GADRALQPMNCQVDLGEARGSLILLMSEEGYALHRVETCTFDEMARLYEHSAGAAGRVEDNPVVRLDDVHDGLHKRRRCEEFPVVMRALFRKLSKKV